MKVRIDRQAFADVTRWSARHLATKPLMPVLTGLLLDAHGDKLTVSGFDYDTSTRAILDADVIEAGRLLVPGRLLADITGSLPGDTVEITMAGEQAAITSGSADFTISLLTAEDYPALPPMPHTVGTVESERFAAAVGQVAFATDTANQIKPWMGCVYIASDGDRLTLQATDSYRVAERTLDWQPTTGLSTPALVPAKTLHDTVKTLAGGQVDIAQSADGGLAGLESAGRCTTLRLIDQTERPDVTLLFPTTFAAVATTALEPLIAAIKRVTLVAVDKTKPVLLGFTDGAISVRAAGDSGAVGKDSVEGRLDGEPMQVAFKHGYLLDGLQAMDAEEEVQFNLTGQQTRAVVHPAVNSPDYRYLVMPIRL